MEQDVLTIEFDEGIRFGGHRIAHRIHLPIPFRERDVIYVEVDYYNEGTEKNMVKRTSRKIYHKINPEMLNDKEYYVMGFSMDKVDFDFKVDKKHVLPRHIRRRK